MGKAMKTNKRMLPEVLSRRKFLHRLTQYTAASMAYPLIGCSGSAGGRKDTVALKPQSLPQPVDANRGEIVFANSSKNRTLLQHGLVVDGTGNKAYYGDVMINGNRVELVTPKNIKFSGKTIDCTGKVVSPGFIDAHSHMDWVLPIKGHPELKTPFTAQGVTTLVTGQCGFGVAGFKADSPHMDLVVGRNFDLYDVDWRTMEGYFQNLQQSGITHNIVNFAGHGTTRTSIRGFEPTPMQAEEMKQMLYLLEEAMDQGAYGVSLGLQYEPGIFATMDELEQVARLVKRKEKTLTVHMKAYSALSGSYPLEFYGRPHNLLALDDMISLARKTGVKLQLSHLIFVGSRTWKNYEEALDLIDAAIQEGLDIQFDTYVYHCGTSVINVFMPEWFLANVPEAYDSQMAQFKLHAELSLIKDLLGFGFQDIQIVDANHPDLNQYNGMFLTEIAAERRMGDFQNFIEFARKSNGRARVLNHRYSNLEIVKALMQHPASLLMTDATPFPKGVQNPGAYGNFPRFLQYARDYRLLDLEDVVHKMTGASAQRFNIKERGVLKNGYFADITIFDWLNIKDNNTTKITNARPSGIETVFINGKQVLDGDHLDVASTPGIVC